jgi:hypothetical protein
MEGAIRLILFAQTDVGCHADNIGRELKIRS